MPRNGSGTYALPAGNPVVTNTTISSTTHNSTMSDIATALTASVATDGQTPMLANLPMGGFKVTNLGTATLSTDATTLAQMQTADAAVTTAYQTADTNIQTGIERKNLLFNGRMEVAQRGTTYALTTTAAFGSIDRWMALQATTANGIFNQVAGPASSGVNLMAKLGRNNGAVTTGAISMAQSMESRESIPAAGQTIILSFYAYKGANFSATSNLISVTVRSGTGTDETTTALIAGTYTGSTNVISTTQAITTTLTRYTFTGSVASTAKQLGVIISYTPTGTAGADDNLYISGIQLEIARNGMTAAGALETVPYTTELTRCKRFYQYVSFNVIGYNTIGANISNSTMLSVGMRATPTIAQITNNYLYASVNITGTTSTYQANDIVAIAYRATTATGTAQFSELCTANADL